jgi:hypothetical protein
VHLCLTTCRRSLGRPQPNVEPPGAGGGNLNPFRIHLVWASTCAAPSNAAATLYCMVVLGTCLRRPLSTHFPRAACPMIIGPVSAQCNPHGATGPCDAPSCLWVLPQGMRGQQGRVRTQYANHAPLNKPRPSWAAMLPRPPVSNELFRAGGWHHAPLSTPTLATGQPL